MKQIKDIIKVVAYIKVFGLDIYGVKHTNLDSGKGNLESYFCDKKNWSLSRLKKAVSLMLREGILKKAPAEKGFKFYSLSLLAKEQIRLIDFEEMAQI